MPETDTLNVQLDAELPRDLAVGRGTALFVAGWCFARSGPIEALAIVVDGHEQPVERHGMPRLDLFRAHHPGLDPYATDGVAGDPDSAEDPNLQSYSGGFWGMARIGPREPGTTCEIGLRALLRDGGEATAPLARIPVVALADPVEAPAPAAGDGPLVAICMAAYEPPAELLRRQIESIRAQTHRNWVCVISDDNSSARGAATLREVVGDDPRFVVSRSPQRLGFYRNFERALALAPSAAPLVAMADQDDRWEPDKLATLIGALGDAQLVYSDARVVARDGTVVSDTYWSRRRNNHSDLLSLLVANSVTGAASLMRRDLLDDALPFPPRQFAHFHDHWVALVALARGDIAFVDRPLYDYVQHGEASLGHAAANQMPRLRSRLGALRRDPRERIRMWRMHYFVDVCRLMQFAAVLELRCGDRMAADRRRALARFTRADRSLAAIGALAARGARELTGPSTETLGAEWMLAHAFTWRRLLSASASERPRRRLRLDAVPPPSLAPKPGRGGLEGTTAREVQEKIAPIELSVRDDAPERVNILIPTFDLKHLFGGYIGKLNLAARLADRGLRVRIVTVDPVGPLPGSWQETVEGYSGLAGLFDRVEVAFARESQGLDVSRNDAFVATTWWTAHVAHAALRSVDAERFLYLIQEYEPFTFPMGSYAALAEQSYRFPHSALFSTELLREWFRLRGIGVYAAGPDAGDAASASFQNAITAIEPPSAGELSRRTSRRLLFYARPEPHAARNMFELGLLALHRALENGAFGAGWELYGIGTVEGRRQIPLGAGAELALIPRAAQSGYAGVLRRHDVGLALMYTPHPSLVPLEMASAGMLTVTNSFENKNAAAMAAISANITAAEPSVDALADALTAAAAGAGDFDRRAAGSQVAWSRDWRRSFDDALLDRVASLLRA